MADAVARQVASQLDGITEEQVQMVLDAWEAVKAGPAVGTVLVKGDGSVAVRVSEDGVLIWHVTGLDGSRSKDLQPTLEGWEVLKSA